MARIEKDTNDIFDQIRHEIIEMREQRKQQEKIDAQRIESVVAQV